MQWHIITGSKGGVGKTLQTLLLLKYFLERKKSDEGVLVLDLNAMNADTFAMLLYNKDVNKSINVKLSKSKRTIILKHTFSLDKFNKPFNFIVGSPINPFELYGYDNFVDLMLTIKKHEQEIATELLGVSTLKHVIIDTNYHFCNLFPDDPKQFEEFKDDEITIWFLWVYRQLKKLLAKNDEETRVIRLTSDTIETYLNSSALGTIAHVYTPVGLLSTQHNNSGFFARLLGNDVIKMAQDSPIQGLLNLEKKSVGEYISFNEWITKLQIAHTLIKDRRSKDDNPHLLFVDVLNEAIRQIAELGDESTLPINIFPMSIYQSDLEGYTDKEREDAVSKLGNLTIYKNFERLLERKYESIHL